MATSSLRYFHLVLGLTVGACWIWSILRLRSYKDPARKFVSALEVALSNFVFANIAATMAGYTVSLNDTQISPDKVALTWQICCQYVFDVSSIATLWALLLVIDGLFIVTKYPWHEPFTRHKVFGLAPFVSCVMIGVSLAYGLFGLWVVWSAKDGEPIDYNQAVVWQVMFELVITILDCMLTVLGYVAYKRTREASVVSMAGALFLLALVLFAARNIGNVLWDWQWGPLGSAPPTAALSDLHSMFDVGLFAVTLIVLTVLGIREREGLASPGGSQETGYTVVAGEEHEMGHRVQN